jgi:hypothetical protein
VAEGRVRVSNIHFSWKGFFLIADRAIYFPQLFKSPLVMFSFTTLTPNPQGRGRQVCIRLKADSLKKDYLLSNKFLDSALRPPPAALPE